MKATAKLHDLGQSLWLDNITRDLLESGTLERYISELSVTGLTSNPTVFDQAIKGSSDYDAAIRSKLKAGKSGESIAIPTKVARSSPIRTMAKRNCASIGMRLFRSAPTIKTRSIWARSFSIGPAITASRGIAFRPT